MAPSFDSGLRSRRGKDISPGRSIRGLHPRLGRRAHCCALAAARDRFPRRVVLRDSRAQLSVIPIYSEYAAEKRMYLPLAAVVLLAVAAAYRLVPFLASFAARLASRLRFREYRQQATTFRRTRRQALRRPEEDCCRLPGLCPCLRRGDRVDRGQRPPERRLPLGTDDLARHRRQAAEESPRTLQLGLQFVASRSRRGGDGALPRGDTTRPRVRRSRIDPALGLWNSGQRAEAFVHMRQAVALQPNFYQRNSTLPRR